MPSLSVTPDSSVGYFDHLNLIFQSHEEFRNRKDNFFVSQFSSSLVLSRGWYNIHIREKHVSSLPAPNCTEGSEVSNIFSTRYTYESCLENCAYTSMYQEYGDSIDIWRKYNPPSIKPFNNSKYI